MNKQQMNEFKNQFQQDSNKTYKNNVENYTKNDFEFLNELNKMFGNAMSAKGLNVLDPLFANFFHYNKMGMRGNVDYPRVTRTYVFFTRPELNFSYENINAVPFFKWLYSKKIGKMIMAALTDPEYFVNAPAALEDPSNQTTDKLYEIMNEFKSLMDQINKTEAEATNDPDLATVMGAQEDNVDMEEQALEEYYAQTYGTEITKNLDDTGAQIKRIQEYDKWAAAEKQKAQTEQNSEAKVVGQQSVTIDTSSKASYMSSSGSTEVNYADDDPEAAAEIAAMNFDDQMYMIDVDALLTAYSDDEHRFRKMMDSKGYNEKLQELYKSYRALIGTDDPDGLRETLNSYHLHQAKHIVDALGGSDDLYSTTHYTSPFIPLLQNCCTQCTGAKDFNLAEFTYEEDEFGMSQKVATGMDDLWGPGTLSTNFEDIAYGPAALMMMTWVLYIHYVSRGYITTTRSHIVERILDYTCSIYVFVVGEDGRRIERWGKYTGCYPTTYPMTQQLEHNSAVDHEMLHKFTISWQYNRYEPMDPNVLTDFNFISETEWLAKLKPTFWEHLYYRRDPNRTASMMGFVDISENHPSDVDKSLWKTLNRPAALWDPVVQKERGISGRIPATLISPNNTTDQINVMNNYWGGYPYINKASELIWVLPQFGNNQGVIKYGKIGAKQYNQSDFTQNGSKSPDMAFSKLDKNSNGIMGSDEGLSNSDDFYYETGPEEGMAHALQSYNIDKGTATASSSKTVSMSDFYIAGTAW